MVPLPALENRTAGLYSSSVRSLSEIEAAASSLLPEQKQELILFLASRLRSEGAQLPPPREFTQDQIASWIAEDEADGERFRAGS
jgi:hypothetical protein